MTGSEGRNERGDASGASRRWPPPVPVESTNDRYAIEHPHGNWIVCTDEAKCGECLDCRADEDNDRRFPDG